MNSPYRYPRARIQLFCKAPIPGQVKTRLIPVLGAEGACELHCRLVNHIASMLLEANLCPIEFWVTPNDHHSLFAPFTGLASTSFHRQYGDDLGQRMFYGVKDALNCPDSESKARAEQVLVIGSDCPAMSAAYLDNALAKLHAGYDAVLGPALDGGYVMLGISRAEPSLFQEIRWGTDEVLAETSRRMNNLAWNWALAESLWDVDTPEDLARLDQIVLKGHFGA